MGELIIYKNINTNIDMDTTKKSPIYTFVTHNKSMNDDTMSYLQVYFRYFENKTCLFVDREQFEAVEYEYILEAEEKYDTTEWNHMGWGENPRKLMVIIYEGVKDIAVAKEVFMMVSKKINPVKFIKFQDLEALDDLKFLDNDSLLELSKKFGADDFYEIFDNKCIETNVILVAKEGTSYEDIQTTITNLRADNIIVVQDVIEMEDYEYGGDAAQSWLENMNASYFHFI